MPDFVQLPRRRKVFRVTNQAAMLRADVSSSLMTRVNEETVEIVGGALQDAIRDAWPQYWPEDGRLVAYGFDCLTNSCEFYVDSREFDPVPEGERCPEVWLP